MKTMEKRDIIFGAAGFIGTNLTIKLQEKKEHIITLVDSDESYFVHSLYHENVRIVIRDLTIHSDFDELLKDQDVLYYLLSTTNPSTSNISISNEIIDNVAVASRVFDACVNQGVQKIVFVSSGGTVYGKNSVCPVAEEAKTEPITSYGLQKLSIEKLLYLYNYIYGIDYRIVRLSNPYGPFQRPGGGLGALTAFVNNIENDKEIVIYGDGSVVRDYIYIEDAIAAILNVVDQDKEKLYNIGSGKGTSLNELIGIIETVLGRKSERKYIDSRKVDVPVNYLDVSKYKRDFGEITKVSLEDGIQRTAAFLKKQKEKTNT